MNESERNHPVKPSLRLPVVVSAAHAYLTPAVIEKLFCDHYRLHEHSRLGQPTQYLTEESITLIGPRGRLCNVRVIGPPREANQVELSRADALALGIDAPVRTSGDLEGTPGIVIEGPRMRLTLNAGVIRTRSHLHMSPLDADRLGLNDKDRVDVSTERNARRILLRDILVRVSPDYRLELHLDADEGKAAGLRSGDDVMVRIDRPGQPTARLTDASAGHGTDAGAHISEAH
jgi:propanediol utilization protein